MVTKDKVLTDKIVTVMIGFGYHLLLSLNNSVFFDVRLSTHRSLLQKSRILADKGMTKN